MPINTKNSGWILSRGPLKLLVAVLVLTSNLMLPRENIYAVPASQEVSESQNIGTETESLELQLVHYSVDSYGKGSLYNLEESLGENQSLLTLEMNRNDAAFINSQRIKNWIENGIFASEDLFFDVDRMVILNKQLIQIVFEIRENDMHQNNYIETEITMKDSEGLIGVTIPVTFYRQKNSVLHLVIDGGEQRPFAENLPARKTIQYKNLRNTEPRIASVYAPVVNPLQKEEIGSRGTFVSRNKFWVMGGVALIGSGTAALITTFSDSTPIYLPSPPGRP